MNGAVAAVGRQRHACGRHCAARAGHHERGRGCAARAGYHERGRGCAARAGYHCVTQSAEFVSTKPSALLASTAAWQLIR